MKKKLWAGMICALALAGLTACGSADVPAAPRNSPQNHSEAQSSNPELSAPLLPKESDVLETGDVPAKPVDNEQEFHVSRSPESKTSSDAPGASISESEPPPTQLQPEPADNSAQPVIQERKILIAYFTWAENTVVEDPSDEKAANARPALTGTVANMADYDVVFLGYPDWWATCPMAVFTFLDSYDFSGKTVIPFCAHGTSGLAASVRDIRAAVPNATVLDAVGVQRPGMDTPLDAAQSAVQSWLDRLEY